MQGDPKVLDYLNTLVDYELAAMQQYFIHSRMYENWGLTKLYQRIDHEMDDEKGHANLMLQRLLMLGGQPDLSTRRGLNIGKDIVDMLNNDLKLEQAGVSLLKEVIGHCEAVGDYQTRDLLKILLKDTEQDHLHWLEQQLGLIARIGLENYQQSQI